MREVQQLADKARGDPDVLALIHYGSSARGEPYRDVDVAVVLADGADALAKWDEYVRASADNVDVRIFRELPLPIQVRVLDEGKVAWCRDEDAFYDLAWSVAKEWEHFRPGYEAYVEETGLA